KPLATHKVPCDIDYRLSEPVNPQLLGLDYIEAWLAQLLADPRWIAQFDAESCVNVLELGTQIDLLLIRDDGIVNMCEIKYYGGDFAVDKAYYKTLLRRQEMLASELPPKVACSLLVLLH
ncbi:MAG: hypothetical protein IJ087_11550, partial [Eggerthellaceae bacterium]|nr:hypothetical protein [Eggerthellaceae bacterium]